MSSSPKPSSHTSGQIPHESAEEATVPPQSSAEDTTAYTPQLVAKGTLPTQFPAIFGRYTLLKQLGQGGMGAVYLAHDSQLDRPVALKIPLFKSDEGSQVLARFYREARSAANILHAHVCPVYDVGEVNGVPYLTMGFIEGKSLSQWIRDKPLTLRQSAALVQKLALTLQVAHKKGVIHRDLKPSNIMIDKRGEPVIMDFGLARRDGPGDARLTQTGAVMGTPAYMPPEQVSGKPEAMGAACDIYSLGVILYELLTCRRPFLGDPMAVLSQVLLDEPLAPSQLRSDLDETLEKICLKAMSKRIENRFATMTQFAAALQDYLRPKTTTPAQPATKTLPTLPESTTRTANSATIEPTPSQPESPQATGGEREHSSILRLTRGHFIWVWIAGGGVLFGIILFLISLKRGPSIKEEAEGHDPLLSGQSKTFSIPLPTTGADGFTPLFNGKDLAGWERGKGDSSVWHVDHGALAFRLADPSQRGWLLTERDYINFQLRLEFRLESRGKSGIGLRMWPGSPKPLEIQIQDERFPAFAAQVPRSETGSLVGIAGRLAELRPPGEWNHMEIDLCGWSLRAAVNDKETIQTQLLDDAVYRYLDGAPPASGRIGLEHGSGSVHFRNLRIKELSSADHENARQKQKKP